MGVTKSYCRLDDDVKIYTIRSLLKVLAAGRFQSQDTICIPLELCKNGMKIASSSCFLHL